MRFRYLTRIGWLDVWRHPRTLAGSALVVAGICLPLLLLVGLKRGLVAQFEMDLLKSPTAREIRLWAVRKSAALSAKDIESLVRENRSVEMIIPDVTKVVQLGTGATSEKPIDVTLQASREGDPYLEAHGVSVFKKGERALVVSAHVAKKLGVEPGHAVRLVVRRKEDDAERLAHVDVPVKGILESGAREAAIGYAPLELLEQVEDYQRGEAVTALGWPAFQHPIRPSYEGYLCFSATALTEMDHIRLKARGLRATVISESDPRQSLFDLLGPDIPEYTFMIVSGASSDGHVDRLTFSAREIETITETEEVAIPWNEPLGMALNGTRFLVVGCTLRPRWLKGYFGQADTWHEADLPEYRAILLEGGDCSEPEGEADLAVAPDVTVSLQIRRAPIVSKAGLPESVLHPFVLVPSCWPLWPLPVAIPLPRLEGRDAISGAKGPRKAVVPSLFLAHLHLLRAGAARFDPSSQMFVGLKQSSRFYGARLYARTLDDVPELDRVLRKRFATESQLTRILEIMSYRHVLEQLVRIVGFVVFLFGWGTVSSLLSDVAARKKRDIGILCCLGISKWAVVYFILVRATLIGALGSILAYVVGIMASTAIDRFVAPCTPPLLDLLWVLPVAVGCCLAGAVAPAIRAATLDPVDCLLGSRMQ